MRSVFRIVLLGLVAAIVISALLIILMLQFSERIKVYDLGSVGSAIGGIASLLIGIVSSVLLYLALIKQIESGNDQKFKSEIDIVLMLLLRLDEEIDKFYYVYHQGKNEMRYMGIEGINKFSNEFSTGYLNVNITFKDLYESNQLLSIARSYQLILERIEIVNLPDSYRVMLKKKARILFDLKLKEALKSICTTLEKNLKMQDEYSFELISFVKSEAAKS